MERGAWRNPVVEKTLVARSPSKASGALSLAMTFEMALKIPLNGTGTGAVGRVPALGVGAGGGTGRRSGERLRLRSTFWLADILILAKYLRGLQLQQQIRRVIKEWQLPNTIR